MDGNTKNYRATNFALRFTETETLHMVCAACIDSQTERTAPYNHAYDLIVVMGNNQLLGKID